MPSSTSSFNAFSRTPALAWGRTWLTTAALLLILLGGSELFWRMQGHRPSVVDDPDLWAAMRSEASTDSEQCIVLLGASRIQLGFNTQAFREQFPDYTVVQLALDGRSPVATLEDLSQDPSFKGVILCDLHPLLMMGFHHADQQEYVDYYHRQASLCKPLDRLIATQVQNRLAIVNPTLNLRRLVRSLLQREWPEPLYVVTHEDRSRSADYQLTELIQHRTQRVEHARKTYATLPSHTPEQWLKEALSVEPMVQRITERGGKVIFLRFPTTDEHWALDQATFPREKYWDRFAQLTSAPTIHFQDYPELSRFECPDTSHLDQRDSARFTIALARLLTDKAVLRGHPDKPALAVDTR